MKRLSLLAAVGLAFALSVGAQTTTDEKQESTQPQEKTNVEQNAKAEQSKATTHRAPMPNEQTNVREKSRTNKQTDATVNERAGANVNERENTRVNEHSRTTSRETTVFRNGREMHENLALRRSFRDRADVHFSIGTHPRDWWIRTYAIVLMDGCHYYLADNGCWYPAYGFDPSCDYPAGVVYCE